MSLSDGRSRSATLVGVAGLWLLVSGLAQRRPALGRVVAYLGRDPDVGADPVASASGWRRGGRWVARRRPFDGDVLADLRLVQRPPEAHAAMLVAAGVVGLVAPALLLGIGQAVGALSIGASPCPSAFRSCRRPSLRCSSS